MKISLTFFALIFTVSGIAQTGYGLKFSTGQQLKYKESISVSNVSTFKNQRQVIKQAGSRIISLKVTSAKSTSSQISVSYSSATATAVAVELPTEFPKDKKSELEKGLKEAMLATLKGSSRTQTTNYLGVTTFKLDAGEGKSISIEIGSFMGLVLPKVAPKPNTTWKAKVSQPDPRGKPITFSYTYIGEAGSNYKITFTATENQSQSREGAKLSVNVTIKGTILLGKNGIVSGGDVTSTITTTITSKEGTQKSVVTTIQNFTKI